MPYIVIHDFVEKNPKELTKNEDADCASCAFSEKTRSIDGVDELLCKAALYDSEILACYAKAYPAK